MTSERWASAARLLLLGVACLGCAVAAFGPWHPARDAQASGFVCPMHPAIVSATPGDCPICGMALVERVAPPAVATGVATLPPGSVDFPRRRVLSLKPTVPARVLANGQVLAIVYDDDLATLAGDERGRFHPAGQPARAVEVVRSPAPPLPWDDASHRLIFTAAGRELPVSGTAGWLELPERSRPALVLPASAIVRGPDGPAVVAVGGEGEGFRRVPVSVGRSPFGLALILSGLRPSERVLVKGAFFVDASERVGHPRAAEH